MANSSETTMLSVRDLTCARGGIAILRHVNLDLEKGQALLLRGPNGCGKTTLLRTISGLQPCVDGQISVAPDHIAYSGHADGIKAALSVEENLRFWADLWNAKD